MGQNNSRTVWINLPTKDISRTKTFWVNLGFGINEKHSNAQMMAISSKNVSILFFVEPVFKSFTTTTIPNCDTENEALFSIDSPSVEDVDLFSKRVIQAGGKIVSEPGYKGTMYGFVFADLDGHKWNVLKM